MKATKQLQPIIDEAKKLGFTASMAGSRNPHLRFDKPGCRAVFFSSSPSDSRAVLNGIAKLRRAAREAFNQTPARACR